MFFITISHDLEFEGYAEYALFIKKRNTIIEKPDPNYILSAKLVNKPTIYEGEKVIINGEVNQKSFISVYGWYPDLYANTYHQIFPNQ